jgi:hypothetical protein
MATIAPGPGRALRWLALPGAIIALAAGVSVAGGVVTDSFRASMALVALWYALAAASTAVIARRREDRARGRRVLTLTGFATCARPDLRVRVLPGAGTDGGARDAVDVGALKGNRGDQQYRLPAGVGAGGLTVVVWCRAFSALFGSARLRSA